MEDASERRRFLRSLIEEAADGAREVAPLIKPFVGPLGMVLPGAKIDSDPAFDDTEFDFAELTRLPTEPAQPVERAATRDELSALAVEHGLGERVAAVQALASFSGRLTLGESAPGARSRFGGQPDLPADVRWPGWSGAPLTFLAQLALDDPALAETGLPSDGLLLLFWALDAMPSGRWVAHRGSARALWVPADAVPPPAEPGAPPRGPSVPERPVVLSAELMLPPVWAAKVEALDLDDVARSGWESMRHALAALQGTEDEPLAGPALALHRLIGHPDEKLGAGPLVCELVDAGVDVGDSAPEWLPEAAGVDESSLPWRLLAQLSLDDELGWAWGDHQDRLFFWIEEDALAERRFNRVLAVPQ